jgi:LPS O-antigen subunit length determinant protein (WzzB/FepE family)
MMYASEKDDGIDLVDLVSTLWKRKLIILATTSVFVAAGVAYALLATPIYRAEALLAPVEREDVPRLLPSGLSGLASLAGVNFGSAADATEAVAALRSRAFIEEFINDKQLLPILFADKWDSSNSRWVDSDPEQWPDVGQGVDFFVEEIRSVDEDAASGLVTLRIEWIDPQLATEWVGNLVERINVRLRARDLADSERRLAYLNEQLAQASLVELRQAIARLIENEIQNIMLAKAEAEYAFRVIDPPRLPREPVAPRRALAVIIAAFVGGTVGVLFAFLVSVSARRREVRPE